MTRTYRRPYRRARAWSKQCRCHGSCPWCRENRLHGSRKRIEAAEAEMGEWCEQYVIRVHVRYLGDAELLRFADDATGEIDGHFV